MGTWRTFDAHGGQDEARSREIIRVAFEHEANLFDTSPMYGEAERVLAGALAGRRREAIIANKVWAHSLAEGRRQISRALGWYGHIDIYQIHNLAAWKEHLPVLEDLRAAGQISVIGATHYQHSAFRSLLDVMETGRIQQIQIPYNALDRVVEKEVLPRAAELGLGVLVMQPLGEGSLVRRTSSPELLAPLARFGVETWAQALLKWILSDGRVHTVIPATSKPQRMRENAMAGNPPWLDEEARSYVESLARRMR
jgi:aryl-alcohol dehydrogenase-like predicted oxidoreductase